MIQLRAVDGGGDSAASSSEDQVSTAMRVRASELSRMMLRLPGTNSSDYLARRWRLLASGFRPLLRSLHPHGPDAYQSNRIGTLYENSALLSAEFHGLDDALRSLRRLSRARTATLNPAPRAILIAQDFLSAVDYEFSEPAFTSYLHAFQQREPLKLAELWAVVTLLKLVLLEQIASVASARGEPETADSSDRLNAGIRSLRDVAQTSWKELIEPLIPFDRVLQRDPTGDYSRMEFESRELYRKAVVEFAEHSGLTEPEIARAALRLAQQAKSQPQTNSPTDHRRAHIGYYLVAEGADVDQGTSRRILSARDRRRDCGRNDATGLAGDPAG
jgi:cyclic beta-1,2-glucan synthetase